MKHTSPHRSRKAAHGQEGKVSAASSIARSDATPRYELILLGADTHAQQYTFGRKIDQLPAQPPQKLSPEAFGEFLKKQRSLAKRVVLLYEAGPYGFALHRQATALGVECLVCAPERLSRGRKRVNDKIDAGELLSRLDRHLSGNTAALRLVRVPTIEQEMSRRLARQRNVFRKERARWMARGRSLLHTMGVYRPGKWWDLQRHAQVLGEVEQRYGATVRQQLSAELDNYLEMLHLVQKKLDELTRELRQAGTERSQPRVKGIGPLSAELLDREIGDWKRFANRRQIASYTGLCPGEDSSGDSQRSLSIDKHGNPRVRSVLVEAAWLLPRYQPDYKPLQKWKWVFQPGKAGKALRKKAAVALGRRLGVDLWRIRTGRARPQDLGLRLIG